MKETVDLSHGQNLRAPMHRTGPAVLVAAALMLASLVLAPGASSATPASIRSPHPAPPTIAQAERRLVILRRQAEIASEAANAARVHLQQGRARLSGLQAGVAARSAGIATLRSALVQAALADYARTGGLSTSASFLAAKTPSQFLDQLATTAAVEYQQTSQLTQLRRDEQRLADQEQLAQQQLAAVYADEQRMVAHQAALGTSIQAAHALLSRLQAKQRQRVLAMQRAYPGAPESYQPLSRGTDRPPVSGPPASGRAAVAVATALAQLGKPYVYGAAGPNAFDCSGLTMYAWAAAGVSLSHASSVQSEEGVPVAISDLQPGDLVFYYSPVSHVAMYIGHGEVVHAPHPGSVVQIVPLTSMPIAWARRVG